MIELGPFARYLDHINERGCWVTWLAPNGSGYGTIWLYDPPGRRKVGLHVASYTHFVGGIPTGLVVDHVCRTRLCFNHDHLEPVTIAENVHRAARQMLELPYPCGHPRTAENSCRNGRSASGAQGYRCAICNLSRRSQRPHSDAGTAAQYDRIMGGEPVGT